MVDAVRQMMVSIEAIGNEGERNDEHLIKMLTRVQQGGSLEEGPAAAATTAPGKHAKSAPPAAEAMGEKKHAHAPVPAEAPPQHAAAADGDAAASGKSKAKKHSKEAKITPVEHEKAPHPEESEAPPAQAASRAGASEGASRGSVGDSSIRVDVVLLDKLMNLVGELALARN
jgi:two-component system, chemotaxis family, sensor kinase CheA